LKLIAEGKSSKEISERLYLSIRTVYRHRADIMKKLMVKNTAELVKFAISERVHLRKILSPGTPSYKLVDNLPLSKL
jgi:hypothetical protein